MSRSKIADGVRRLTPALLRRSPLPDPGEGADKDDRGRVLVIGGSRETPGSIVLAAEAALRAGAGKLQVAAGRSVSALIACAVPEALVESLPETRGGAISASAARPLRERLQRAQAVLVGPGIAAGSATEELTRRIIRFIAGGNSARLTGANSARLTGATLVLDAEALRVLRRAPGALRRLHRRAILTPHAGELSAITGRSESSIERDPHRAARDAAARFAAVVVLKGPSTVIAAPDGTIRVHEGGNVGLAASGSGDVLSGIAAGLAARGASPLTAACWAVFLHAKAGDRLARRMGPLGYLPRELASEVPALMAKIGGRR